MAGFATWYRDQLPPATADEFDHLNASLKAFLAKSFKEDGSLIAPPAQFNFVPVGSVLPYAGSTAPQGWLLADGAAISRVTYGALFTVLGVAYGSGDGSTTFNLPDLRQRFPLGKAASGTGATLGASGGAIDHVHTGPSHSHTVADHQHSVPALSIPSLSTSADSVLGTVSTGSAGSHNHSYSGTTGANDSGGTEPGDGGTAAAVDGHAHAFSGTTSSDGAHSHSASFSGATVGGSTSTGVTGSGTSGSAGTQTTSASGTGNTGATNPAFLALNYIVLASVLG